jgi:hypothetical protein
MERNYAGAKSIKALITAITVFAVVSFAAGIIMSMVAFLDKETLSILYGLKAVIFGLGFIVVRALLKGFESIVIASDMYIEQKEMESVNKED